MGNTYTHTVILSNPATQNLSFTVASNGAVFASVGDGILGTAGFAWTVSNFGTVSTTATNGIGIDLTAGGLVINGQSGGTAGIIAGSRYGVAMAGSGAVVNYGSIRGGLDLDAQLLPVSDTVVNSGVVDGNIFDGGYGTVINRAVIAGYVFVRSGLLTNDGVISAAVPGRDAEKGGIEIQSGVVNNTGTISASSRFRYGAFLTGGTLTNSGEIIGPIGVSGNYISYPASAHGAVVNYGTIIGNSGAGASVGGYLLNVAEVLTNLGLITGGTGAGVQLGYGADTVTNFGMITSNSGTAVAFGSGADLLVVEPGAVFNGAISGFNALDTIDIAHEAVDRVTFANDTLTALSAGTIVAALTLPGTYVSNDFALSPDGNGGVDITLQQPTGRVIGGYYYGTVNLSNPTYNYSATVTSTGTIKGPFDAVYGGGKAGALANYGTITQAIAGGHGVNLGQGGIVTNIAGGSGGGYILGSSAGVTIGGGAGTVMNTGTIAGGSGVVIAGGVNATVANAGTITGTTGNAVSLGGGTNRLILAPGALFHGAVDGGGGQSVLEVAGLAGGAAAAGAVNAVVGLGSIVDFTTLQIDAGAMADASGALSFATLVNAGQIVVAAGDSLVFGLVASAANTGIIALHPGGLVEFSGAAAAQTIEFGPPGGTARIDQAGSFGATLAGFAVGDTIDLAGAQAADAHYAGGVLTLAVGGTEVALAVTTPYAAPAFVLTGDGQGGTDITVLSHSPPNDFTGTGPSDILWRSATGNVAIWEMNGGTLAASAIVGFADPTAWTIRGTGDFNGDGKSDILWQDNSGNVAIWDMNGFSVAGSAVVGFADPGAWNIAATGDFDGNGTSDILWRQTNGNVDIWEMNGGSVTASAVVGFADPTAWHIKGTGDFNGDGKSDILWQDTSGDVDIWEMNGFSIAASAVVGFADPANWHIRGTGDFNGDGMSDILWQDTSGDVAIWEMNGLSVAASAVVGFADPSQWHIAGIGDYNGDGKSDILWQSTSGNVDVWEMNGLSVAATALVGFADPASWSIVPLDNTGDTAAAAAAVASPVPLAAGPPPTGPPLHAFG